MHRSVLLLFFLMCKSETINKQQRKNKLYTDMRKNIYTNLTERRECF
jgi:hypothetical protein